MWRGITKQGCFAHISDRFSLVSYNYDLIDLSLYKQILYVRHCKYTHACMFDYLSIHFSSYLSIYLSIYLSLFLFFQFYLSLSICLSTYLQRLIYIHDILCKRKNIGMDLPRSTSAAAWWQVVCNARPMRVFKLRIWVPKAMCRLGGYEWTVPLTILNYWLVHLDTHMHLL